MYMHTCMGIVLILDLISQKDVNSIVCHAWEALYKGSAVAVSINIHKSVTEYSEYGVLCSSMVEVAMCCCTNASYLCKYSNCK